MEQGKNKMNVVLCYELLVIACQENSEQIGAPPPNQRCTWDLWGYILYKMLVEIATNNKSLHLRLRKPMNHVGK